MSKGIPDLRRGYTITEVPPPDDVLEKLAARHGFDTSFKLPERLQFQWEWWCVDENLGAGPTGTEIKAFLRETAERAKALEEAIDHAGGLGSRLLVEGNRNVDLQLLKRQSHILRSAATIALSQDFSTKTGPKHLQARNNLIAQLIRIWDEAKGTSARTITNFDNKYSGPLVDFTFDALAAFGYPGLVKNVIGKAIVEIRRKLREADRSGDIP